MLASRCRESVVKPAGRFSTDHSHSRQFMSKTRQGYRVALAGATGAVGQVMLELLAERDFPISELALLASSRSAGSAVSFKGKSVRVQELASFDFSGWDFAMFSAGGSVSAEHAPRAAKAGCT